MSAYWVGLPGEPTSAQVGALEAAGLEVKAELRESSGGRRGEWRTLRTFIRIAGRDAAAAREQVAAVLDLDTADLVAYDAGAFH